MSTKRRRSNRLHNSKAPDISLESTANHLPVTKKPPKFNRKRNEATEKSDKTQPTSSGLRFRLPALPRVTKGAKPVVNMSAKPIEKVLSHDESDKEVDELSSPVKIQTPPKKRPTYRNPQEIQITPPPPLDPGLLRKAAQAEALWAQGIFPDVAMSVLNLNFRTRSVALQFPKTSSSIALESKDDWAACIEDVISSHSRRPKTKQLAPIDLVVVISEQYLKSLHAHQHPSSSTKAKGRHGKSKIKAVKILNLDGSDNEDVEFDAGKDDEDTGASTSLLSNAEKEWMEKLKNTLRQCQKCGREEMCKIDIQGNHTKVTFQMLCPWVKALAAEVHGVTLKSPPKNNMFSRFFCGPAKDSTSTLSISMDLPPHASDQTPSTPAPSALTPSTLAPGAPMPTYIPMPMPIQLPGHQISSPYSGSHISPSTLSPLRPPMISSDPPETLSENKYDTVCEFLGALHQLEPRRQLDSFIVKFEQEDYWNIDGIAAMSKTELMAAPFGLSSGNATYLLEKCKIQVEKVDRSSKRRRLQHN
ncbi:hypothetical protein FB446DRAFT_788820 [Lentinula raphanica]|nr:hypothetical protein FB446DRAFT_788820 [Lentinula raphanica]